MAARRGSVGRAVARELKAMDAATSSLGAAALALARQLDGEPKAADVAACAKALRETLDRLRELSPPKQEKTESDELAAGRARRRRAIAARSPSS
jgi:hypothetical protein